MALAWKVLAALICGCCCVSAGHARETAVDLAEHHHDVTELSSDQVFLTPALDAARDVDSGVLSANVPLPRRRRRHPRAVIESTHPSRDFLQELSSYASDASETTKTSDSDGLALEVRSPFFGGFRGGFGGRRGGFGGGRRVGFSPPRTPTVARRPASLWRSTKSGVSRGFQRVTSVARSGIRKVATGVRNLGRRVATRLRRVGGLSRLNTGIKTGIRKVRTGIRKIGSHIGNGYRKVRTAVRKVRIGALKKKGGDRLKNGVRRVWGAVKKGGKKGGDRLKNGVKRLWGPVKKVGKKVKSSPFWQKVKNTMKTTPKKIKDAMKKGAKGLKSAIQKLKDKGKGAVSKVKDYLKKNKDFLKDLPGKLKGKLRDLLGKKYGAAGGGDAGLPPGGDGFGDIIGNPGPPQPPDQGVQEGAPSSVEELLSSLVGMLQNGGGGGSDSGGGGDIGGNDGGSDGDIEEQDGPRRVSARGRELIKEHEGLRLKAYADSAGVSTIGYGHTGNVKKGQVISKVQAEKFLDGDLATAANAVNRLVTVPLSQNQFDALVSFTFNLGSGSLKGSTLLKMLNAGRPGLVPAELLKWDKATVNGKLKVLPGLTTRRKKEAALWNRP